jgi:hypothetical protein
MLWLYRPIIHSAATRLPADNAGANAVGFGKIIPAGFASRLAIISRRYEVAR